jgi:hypothetical protein
LYHRSEITDRGNCTKINDKIVPEKVPMAAHNRSICLALRMLKSLLQIEWVVKATPLLLYAPVKSLGIVVGEVIGYGSHSSLIGV